MTIWVDNCAKNFQRTLVTNHNYYKLTEAELHIVCRLCLPILLDCHHHDHHSQLELGFAGTTAWQLLNI